MLNYNNIKELSNKKYKLIAVEGVDGSGKTTLLKNIESVFWTDQKVLKTYLAREVSDVFKDMVDRPSGLVGEYQNVIPPDFRYSAFVFAGIFQFLMMTGHYNKYDIVLFDRWWLTNEVYLEKPGYHQEWFDKYLSYLPEPDHYFYLKVRPETAVRRLCEEEDWMTKRYDPATLLSRFHELVEKFETFTAAQDITVLDAEQGPEQVLALALATISAHSEV